MIHGNHTKHPKLNSIKNIISMMLRLEAILMLVSTGVALVLDSGDVIPLLESTAITFAVGFILSSRTPELTIDKKAGYISVALTWLIIPVFGSLPFLLGGYIPSITDAIFETVSGFTTTGATILDNIESLPRGILFWRSIIQWIGGIGIVVVVISLIQIEGGGATSLFAAEIVGPDKDKITPSTRKTGSILVRIYVLLTLICALAYWAGGMGIYDAVCHSFTTLSSGGFSTKDASAAAFPPLIQYLMILFMLPAGTNFILMYYVFKGKFSKLRQSDEFKTYIIIIITFSLLIAAFIYSPQAGMERTLRDAFFQVISIMTTTGYTTANYGFWGTPSLILLFVLMFVGAMSGSTSGGVKIVRTLVLFKNARSLLKNTIHNQALMPIKLNKHNIPNTIIYNVLAVFLLYVAIFVVAILSLSLCGLRIEEAMEGTLSCLGCVGPIYVQNETLFTFATFPDAAKWIFGALMYLGRLEIVSVFVVFLPAFWKK
ncbi:MAG: TrkH family potassium uptake protein [Bacteroidales bacterium]|jgi:trk system potassium uptake protein TrkH|nr:TrkH family potassium uptake protein [Bacteroidales bacterium]